MTSASRASAAASYAGGVVIKLGSKNHGGPSPPSPFSGLRPEKAAGREQGGSAGPLVLPPANVKDEGEGRLRSQSCSQHRVNRAPGARVQPPEKTAGPPGVTGDPTGRFDHVQQHVGIAVEPDFTHLLAMTGLFALAPQLAARSRKIYGVAACLGLKQRRTIGP